MALRSLTVLLLPLVVLVSAAGCGGEPYFTGEGPQLTGVDPAFENGNLGGSVVIPQLESLQTTIDELAAIEEPTEDETAALAAAEEQHASMLSTYVVTIRGSFGACETPLVSVGSRTAILMETAADRLRILTPPGPVSGGVVDVQVSCGSGLSVIEEGYDYVLGAVTADGDEESGFVIGKRMEGLFRDEFASFTLFYQAEPFINWPEPVGYGIFFNGEAARSSLYYGGNPGMFYGGSTWNAIDRPHIPAQVPPVNFEAPEQGDRIRAGSEVTFFRRRATSNPAEPLTSYARKRPITSPIAPDPNVPDPHTSQSSNNVAAWVKIPYTVGDESGTRYARVAQWVGAWCGESREGCGEGNDDLLNDTRIPLDFRWKWFEPDTPDREHLVDYPDVAPEHVAFLQCVDDGTSEDDCEEASGLGLPSGTYTNVHLCKSFDEFEDFPWENDGFCIVVESLDSVELVEGSRYMDVDRLASGNWRLDEENNVYSGFEDDSIVGENVLVRGEPVYIAYGEGYYRGNLVPAKNADLTIPDAAPELGSSAYDATPYVVLPELDISTFLGGDSPFNGQMIDDREFFGFPALLPYPEAVDWAFSLPGGQTDSSDVRTDSMSGGGWEDTYFVVTLEVRDTSLPSGLGNTTVWSATAWAWAGDDYIYFPSETLATLPLIGDAFRPDDEVQRGGDLIGLVSIEIHRAASWKLGEDFDVNTDARVVFDANAITMGYFHNQHSCYDEMDNDGDGLCDIAGCDDPEGNRLPADPACIAAEGEDDQPEYETAVCQNLEDDDEDGLIDMDDPDCSEPNDTLEEASCGDGIDNDGDGWTDFPEDPGCSDAGSSDEGGLSYLSDCNDGIDDDGDGMVDSEDPGCENGADNDESGDTCSNGEDDNEYGWIDTLDWTCQPYGGGLGERMYTVGELDTLDDYFECSDSAITGPEGLGPFDNDGDGFANADDPDCVSGYDISGEGSAPNACADGADNDGDGWIDALDPECLVDPSSESEGPPGGSCADGADNDGDGWIDALDPDCPSGAANEAGTSQLQCNNGIDDDSDGHIDGDDPDCPTGKDNHEES